MATAPTIIPKHPACTLRIILVAGMLAGFLDGLDAAVFIGLVNRIAVMRVFQFIASGALGMKLFQGGWATASLGVVFHFLIAVSAAAVFYGISRRFPTLLRRPLLSGAAYGIGVFLFMHYLVVPLSAAPRQPPIERFALLNLIFSHVFFVGIPIAIVTARAARERVGQR